MPALPRVDRLFPLLFRRVVRDGKVAAKPLIDPFHQSAEERPVRRGVRQLVESDVVMDHFVDDGIFQHLLRHLDPSVDAQREVEVLHLSVRPSAPFEATRSEECLRIAQTDTRHRKLTRKELPVKLLKLLLDIGNRCVHSSLFFLLLFHHFFKKAPPLCPNNARGRCSFMRSKLEFHAE